MLYYAVILYKNVGYTQNEISSRFVQSLPRLSCSSGIFLLSRVLLRDGNVLAARLWLVKMPQKVSCNVPEWEHWG